LLLSSLTDGVHEVSYTLYYCIEGEREATRKRKKAKKTAAAEESSLGSQQDEGKEKEASKETRPRKPEIASKKKTRQINRRKTHSCVQVKEGVEDEE
jgi:hypothetical protein